MRIDAETQVLEAMTASHWQAVRTRIDVINSHLGEIECTLGKPDVEKSEDVVHRMEALQEKFEKVMGQLAAFDDEGGQAVREAKENFREIVRRYRQSRQGSVRHH